MIIHWSWDLLGRDGSIIITYGLSLKPKTKLTV